MVMASGNFILFGFCFFFFLILLFIAFEVAAATGVACLLLVSWLLFAVGISTVEQQKHMSTTEYLTAEKTKSTCQVKTQSASRIYVPSHAHTEKSTSHSYIRIWTCRQRSLSRLRLDSDSENGLFGFGAIQINSVLFYSVHSRSSMLVLLVVNIASRAAQLMVWVRLMFFPVCISFTRSPFWVFYLPIRF